MKIKSLKLKDFRPFHKVKKIQDGNKEIEVPVETEIQFSTANNSNQTLTVFIGENGSGKTAILDALAILFTQIFISEYSYMEEEREVKVTPLLNSEEAKLMHENNGYFLNESDLYSEEKDNNEKKVYPTTIEIELENENMNYFWRVDGYLNEIKKFNQSITTIDSKNEIPSYKDLIAYLQYNLRKNPEFCFPVFCYYQVDGSIRENENNLEVNSFNLEHPQLYSLHYAFTKEDYSLKEFSRWFITKERDENRKIKSKNDLTYRDPNLEIIRYVLNKLSVGLGLELDEIQEDSNEPNRIVIRKNGKNFYHFSQLSAGEKRLLFLFLDIAQKICIANPGLLNLRPKEILKQAAGVVIIDEMDLHLHPKWQRLIVPTLSDTFQGLQFIATTHSVLVVQSLNRNDIRIVKKRNILLLEELPYSTGRPVSSILYEFFEEEEIPIRYKQFIQKIYEFIEKDKVKKAKRMMDKLKSIWGPDEIELKRLEWHLEDKIWDLKK